MVGCSVDDELERRWPDGSTLRNLAAETEDNHEELLGVTLRNMNFSLSLFKKHIMETRGRVNA